MKDLNRIKGALYGVAVGDVIGKTSNLDMTMAVAQGIIDNPQAPISRVGKRFLNLYLDGKTENEVIEQASLKGECSYGIISKDEWHTLSAHYGKDSSAELLRTLFIGLYYNEVEDVAMVAEDVAKMTTHDGISIMLCGTYSMQIHAAIRGIMPYPTKLTDNDAEPLDYAFHTYINAYQALSQTTSFYDAVLNASRRGVGSVTGGLAGAVYGYDEIPKEWIDLLDAKTQLKLNLFTRAAYEKQEVHHEMSAM